MGISRTNRKVLLTTISLSLLVALAGLTVHAQQDKPKSPFAGVSWRQVGPFRGGRAVACVGVPSQPNVFYFGSTGGGVWKSTDGGASWKNVSDGFFKTGSVGAIAVADSDPNVIYVGMGEYPIRGNVSYGDGVYKSTDAGKTWRNVGLQDTQQISRVRIDPRNPDVVYVAALGHVWGANPDRGIFKSTDGGKTWKKILYKSDRTGGTDLVVDPGNANNIYAALWEVYRTPYSLVSGGPGSGLYKSTDAGETWADLTHAPGMPKGVIGNYGLTVSPANPERVWAQVENADGGLFRSDNGGKSWMKINDERKLRQRAWYFSKIFADPKNPDEIYALNTGFYRSNDGGRTFNSVRHPHGDDHDLWINPNDPRILINCNDGGAAVTFNSGESWSTQDNQPTAQFYRVSADTDTPYNIYGAQQDNSTVRIASASDGFGIDQSNWYDVGGGESGWIQPLPGDSKVVFAGSYDGLLTRQDRHTGQTRDVSPWPDNPMGYGAGDIKYRFQWNYPIIFSPHEKSTMYVGAQVLFKSTDQGGSWEVISPDLTRNDKSRQGSSGGPITKDNTSIEYYDVIFTVMESPLKKGLIWVGTDDGLVQLTQDGGKNWTNVTPKDMPEWIQINSLDASPLDPGTCYVAGTMYKSDDFKPYLYKTTDYGKTWTRINNGIPDGAFTRVIRADPVRKGLLYAGTETGIYVSQDDGASWQSLQLNLPIVPVTDLLIKEPENNLIAATQGRAFWILDDLTVLQQMNEEASAGDIQLFKPAVAYRSPGGGFPVPAGVALGQNPPGGAVIYYYLKEQPKSEITLEFLDPNGKLIKKYSNKKAEAGRELAPDEDDFFSAAVPHVMENVGLNHFDWNMRYPDAVRFPGLIMWGGSTTGPRAIPGNYQVRLTVDGKTQTQTLEIKKDPRIESSQDDFAKQFDFLIKVRDSVSEMNTAVIHIREARKQIDEIVNRVKDDPAAKQVVDAGKSLEDKMKEVEEALYQTQNRASEDPLNFPIKLNNKMAALGGVASEGDYAPTAQDYAVFKELSAAVTVQLDKLNQIMKTDLPAFNRLIREKDIPAVYVSTKKPE